MSKLIDREDLLEAIRECEAVTHSVGYSDMIAIIEDAPEIKPKPRRHGLWETCEDYDGDVIYRCSACGEEWTLIAGMPKENNMYYCPNCGARMDGGAYNANN